MSFFWRDELAEKNVIKQTHDYLGMIFKGDCFAKKHIGVDVLQESEDLKNAFINYIQKELKRIVASDNPYRNFREKLIGATKMYAINEVLLGKEFQYTRDKICEAINRGNKVAEEKEFLKQAMALVRDAEAFSDQPWGFIKLAHESAWAEVEILVLRHLQIMVFERVNKRSDWWDIYYQAYTKYVTDLYRLISGDADITEGFPHPMIAAMGYESLMGMEQSILNSGGKSGF